MKERGMKDGEEKPDEEAPFADNLDDEPPPGMHIDVKA
jgi:hypothetical protein